MVVLRLLMALVGVICCTQPSAWSFISAHAAASIEDFPLPVSDNSWLLTLASAVRPGMLFNGVVCALLSLMFIVDTLFYLSDVRTRGEVFFVTGLERMQWPTMWKERAVYCCNPEWMEQIRQGRLLLAGPAPALPPPQPVDQQAEMDDATAPVRVFRLWDYRRRDQRPQPLIHGPSTRPLGMSLDEAQWHDNTSNHFVGQPGDVRVGTYGGQEVGKSALVGELTGNRDGFRSECASGGSTLIVRAAPIVSAAAGNSARYVVYDVPGHSGAGLDSRRNLFMETPPANLRAVHAVLPPYDVPPSADPALCRRITPEDLTTLMVGTMANMDVILFVLDGKRSIQKSDRKAWEKMINGLIDKEQQVNGLAAIRDSILKRVMVVLTHADYMYSILDRDREMAARSAAVRDTLGVHASQVVWV